MKRFTQILLAITFGLSIHSVFAQAFDKPALCLESAAYSANIFSQIQTLVKEHPEYSDVAVDGMRKSLYDAYKKRIAEEGTAAAAVWQLRRTFGELGVNEYKRDPNASPDEVERRAHDICMSPPKK